jgi:DNA polymerase elongation subunit (family B)
MYGAMGVRKGYLPFMPGAMCITYFGRQSIEKTAKTIVEKWGGELIYGDTDSNYVTFPQKRTIQETWDYAIEVADGISKEFPPPMKLEFEGTIYERFLILSKKRYMYQEIDRDGNLNKKIGKKGVILARRDNSGMMRKIYERVAQMIFDRNTKAEIEFEVIEYINNLFRNVLDYKDYVITKSIGDTEGDIGDHSKLGDYKVRQRLPDDIDAKNLVLQGRSEKDFYISQCPAHVQLAERMRNRGIPVSAGSRIEFVVVKRHSRNATLGERLEDFDTFKKYSWVRKIDTEYYLNSLINSLDQMLAVGIQNDHFVNDQYDIRMKFEKVLDQIKQRGYYKIVTK